MPTLQFPSRAFAAVYDKLNAGPEEAGLAALRRDLLAGTSGPTVEIGAGTGLNLRHYPPAVTRLVLTEPDANMRTRVQAKLRESGLEAELVDAHAACLGFPDASFDSAVCTMVLCTVPDVPAALTEIRRVLKPGGRLFFLEHVRAESAGKARLQTMARPIYRVMGRGCNPTRDTLSSIRAAGFDVEAHRRVVAPKTPPTENELLVGSAINP